MYLNDGGDKKNRCRYINSICWPKTCVRLANMFKNVGHFLNTYEFEHNKSLNVDRLRI